MRQFVYEKLDYLYPRHSGYIGTKELLAEGFTNRQIAQLLDEGYLEKIANGSFWMPRKGGEKPHEYKAVEVCMVNGGAVVIADSACYYQGLISVEPPKLSIATKRSDRHQMIFPFAVTRHYLAERDYTEGMCRVETKYGNYNLYEIGRSVCDCIRFRESIEEDIFELVIENYRKEPTDRQTRERLLAYAARMKFEEKAKKFI